MCQKPQKNMRKISRYVCTYFITAMLLIGCLLAAASIPRSAIEKNASASAEFLAADPAVFHYQVEKAPASIRDQFEYGIYGSIVLVLFIMFFMVIPVWNNRVRVRSKIDWNCIRLYLVLGTLPYIRYLLLPTHTSHHYFFMHRAQAVTVLALCFVVREFVEKNPKNMT